MPQQTQQHDDDDHRETPQAINMNYHHLHTTQRTLSFSTSSTPYHIIHTYNQLINAPLFYPPAIVRTWSEHDLPLEERLQYLHQVLATPTYIV